MHFLNRPALRSSRHERHATWARLASAVAVLCAACAARASVTGSTSPRPADGRTLIAVFAHPDDETIVSSVLAHYARQGAHVYLVVVTDGRKGVSKHAGIPAGDSLAIVRAGEARCSARELGIQPPILLGYEDAGLAVMSPYPGEPLDRLADRLLAILRELRPDAVITWGPEGGYGHPDHRLVGNVVTELFQADSVPSGERLYYPGFTPDRLVNSPRWFEHHLLPVSQMLLTTIVQFDDADRDAARRAINCYRSQATTATMDESLATLTYLWQGHAGFQQWGGGKPASDLF